LPSLPGDFSSANTVGAIIHARIPKPYFSLDLE
jgi:hypothetical protein